MRVIDVNWWLGPEMPLGADSWQGEAWVIDPRQRVRDPSPFDESLIASCLGRAPQLRPQLVAIPSSTRELELRLDALKQAGGAPLARICPGAGHGYPAEPWVIAPLPELCDSRGIPLALDYPDLEREGSWGETVRLARTYPRLPVILVAAAVDRWWTADRALDAAPNLILEVSAATDPVALGRLVNEHGAHRFVYGSGRDRTGVEVVATGVRRERDCEALLAGTADLLCTGRWGDAFL